MLLLFACIPASLLCKDYAETKSRVDYLHFAGWKDVEIVDLCARDEHGARVTDDHGTVLVPVDGMPDHLDPLWVVRGTKRSVE